MSSALCCRLTRAGGGRAGELKQLYEADQLWSQRKMGNVFLGAPKA